LWDYRYVGAMINYLQKWMDQLRSLLSKLAR